MTIPRPDAALSAAVMASLRADLSNPRPARAKNFVQPCL